MAMFEYKACMDLIPISRNASKFTNEFHYHHIVETLVFLEPKHLPSVEAEGSMRSHVQHPWSTTSTSQSTPPISHNPPTLPDCNSTAKRRPYYGWICSDDEEDLVELRPGPLAEEIENWLSSFRDHKKMVGCKT
ncbi:hypothetical protein REPUB_Repub13aG0094900 [Reevesia pubescens]